MARERSSEKLELDFRRRIQSGEWGPGTLVPSRRSMAQEYHVGMTTVERAIANLLAEGALMAQDRMGTFVAPNMDAGNGQGVSFLPTSFAPTEPLQMNVRVGVIAPIYDDKVDPLDAIVHGSNNPFAGYGEPTLWQITITSALERALSARGAETQFINASSLDRLETDSAAATLQGLDALIVINVYNFYSQSDIDALIAQVNGERPIPIVFASSTEMPDCVYQVFCDQQYAGFKAAEHLMLMGYRRLLFLGASQADWAQQRLEGARTALRQAGAPSEMLEFRRIAEDPEEGTENSCLTTEVSMLNELDPAGLRGGPDQYGMIATHDLAAFRVYRAAKQLGLRPGEDFGLVGFDDEIHARWLGLTTMRPPLEAIGEEAAALVLGALTGREARRQVRLQSHLVRRNTTRSIV